MDRETGKELFERFGLIYYDHHDTEDLLIAIMRKLAEIEDQMDAITKRPL